MKYSLKTVRDNIGLTQEQVSILTGVPVKTLRNWEQEIRTPSEWTLDLIIDRLLRIKIEEQLKIDDESGVLSYLTIKEKVCEVAKNYDIDKIYLFGSYVKGQATEQSDIDIYMESNLFGLEYFGFTEKLREKLHKKIGLLSNMTVNQMSKISQEIEATGMLIYER
jgi:predicted nucleotidyltransferase